MAANRCESMDSICGKSSRTPARRPRLIPLTVILLSVCLLCAACETELYRYSNGRNHWVKTGPAPGQDYWNEGFLAYVLVQPPEGVTVNTLYSCWSDRFNDHMISLSSTCDNSADYRLIGIEGYVCRSSGCYDGYTVPLHRCRSRSYMNHFASRQSNCEGEVYDGRLGYVK